MIITRLAFARMGNTGAYGLGAIIGFADVDPFIMGMTQATTQLKVSAGAILIATASNNVAKGIYAYAFGSRQAGKEGLMLLFSLAAAGLIPLIFL